MSGEISVCGTRIISRIKLTGQVKLQPTPEQAYALLRTLETANKACDRLSELAWEAQEFGQYSLHKAFYRTIRDEFPLSAQVVVRLNAKVADAYKIDQKAQHQFRTHGSPGPQGFSEGKSPAE